MFIIPRKQDNERFIYLVSFINKINNLDIDYNPKKTIYPRLRDSSKRGKPAIIEILQKVQADIHREPFVELIWILKVNAQIKNKSGKKYIEVSSFENIQKHFDNNFKFFENMYDLESWIENKNKGEMIKDVFINPIDYLKGHIQGLELNNNQKMELIEYIIKL